MLYSYFQKGERVRIPRRRCVSICRRWMTTLLPKIMPPVYRLPHDPCLPASRNEPDPNQRKWWQRQSRAGSNLSNTTRRCHAWGRVHITSYRVPARGAAGVGVRWLWCMTESVLYLLHEGLECFAQHTGAFLRVCRHQLHRHKDFGYKASDEPYEGAHAGGAERSKERPTERPTGRQTDEHTRRVRGCGRGGSFRAAKATAAKATARPCVLRVCNYAGKGRCTRLTQIWLSGSPFHVTTLIDENDALLIVQVLSFHEALVPSAVPHSVLFVTRQPRLKAVAAAGTWARNSCFILSAHGPRDSTTTTTTTSLRHSRCTADS